MAAGDLLILPPRGSRLHRKELRTVVVQVNRLFVRLAKPLLRAERLATGVPDLELTLLLTERGLELAYCAPFPDRPGAPAPGRRTAAQARAAVTKAKTGSGKPLAALGRTGTSAGVAAAVRSAGKRVPRIRP